jgi:pilus assembly protein CpaC
MRQNSVAMKGMTVASRLVIAAAVLGLAVPARLAAQSIQEAGVVPVAVGNSTVLAHSATLQRVSISDPDIADAVPVSTTEVVINGKQAGTTSLLLWDTSGGRTLYSIQVNVDVAPLEHRFGLLFPNEPVEVSSTGTTIVLSGEVSEIRIANHMLAIAESSQEGVTVIDNMAIPRPDQVLLHVRFAEVRRSAMEELSFKLARIDPFNIRGDEEGALSSGGKNPFRGNFLNEPIGPDQTFSDAMNIYLFSPDAQLGLFINALKSKGLLKSLAEPNLLAVDGQEASFLAGGEFPYPVLQGSANNNAVTIVFKEFGIRLNFTPTIMNSGTIRLHVAPEVSALDFSGGLEVAGFSIPTLLSRKAETEVELRDGQTFAIAGLIDNALVQNISKVPVLGDIPILGALFRSKEIREDRSELLVLVTPQLVQPADTQEPVPTGEPTDWDWSRDMRDLYEKGGARPLPTPSRTSDRDPAPAGSKARRTSVTGY